MSNLAAVKKQERQDERKTWAKGGEPRKVPRRTF